MSARSPARGHDLVVFARSATRSGLPGTPIDGDVRDRAALERAARGCDAISSFRRARQHLAAPARQDFDDVNVGGLCERPGRRPTLPASRAIALHVVVPRAAAARGTDLAARRERLPADESRRRSARRRGGRDGGSRSFASIPASCTARARSPKATCRPPDRGSSRAQLPGLVGAGESLVLRVCRRCRGGPSARRSRRGRAGGRYVLGGENAPQRACLRDRAAPHRTPAAALAFRSRSPTLLGAAEELRVTAVRRHAADHPRRGRHLSPRLVARQQRRDPRPGLHVTPLEEGVARTLASAEADSGSLAS